MENTKKADITKKLVITIISMVTCLFLIGVVVYAAVSQTVNLSNTITVTTSGQTKSIVTVYEAQIEGTTAITTLPAEPTWGEAILTKDQNTDKADKDLTPIVFSHSEGKIAYAYKITIQNKSTVKVTVDISSSTESNEQIDIYAGETFASATKLENNTGVNFDKTDVAENNGELTYYIIVCANTDLADMTATEGSDFDITLSISAQSANS